MADGNQSQGCPACRFAGRTCRPTCVLAPFFQFDANFASEKSKPNPHDDDDDRQSIVSKSESDDTGDEDEDDEIDDGVSSSTNEDSSSQEIDNPPETKPQELNVLRGRFQTLDLSASSSSGSSLGLDPNSRNGFSCAWCQKNRKQCGPECLLYPYFPASRADDLDAVAKIFGVETLTNVLMILRPETRPSAVESMVSKAKALAFLPGAERIVSAIVNNLVGDLLESEAYQAFGITDVQGLQEVEASLWPRSKLEMAMTKFEGEQEFKSKDYEESPLRMAIYELHAIIEQQEHESQGSPSDHL